MKVGAFVGAYALKRNERFFGLDRESLVSLLAWFEDNVSTPDRFTRTRSKRPPRHKLGLSWFKPSATLAVRKMRELTAVLARHGYVVEELDPPFDAVRLDEKYRVVKVATKNGWMQGGGSSWLHVLRVGTPLTRS